MLFHNIMNKKMLLIAVFSCYLFLFISISSSRADTFPNLNSVPGGIAVINLNLSTENIAPYVSFNKKRVMVLAKQNAWYAVVGIPLKTKPGTHRIKVKTNISTKSISFKVKQKIYKSQYITIKNKRKVNPYAKDMDRIIKEKRVIGKVFKSWRSIPNVDNNFTAPVDGPFSSPFGLKRFFNKQPRRPHSGLDIAAKSGTAITAPSAGIITNTGDYFFNGKTVFIDHGQGLITMYCHMSKIDVKAGQKIKKGEKIGEVGMTGRVTGPHLHWSVNLNNTRVDPTLFLKKK